MGIMQMKVSVTDYAQEHQSAIRRILERIGWAEQYIHAAVKNAEIFSRDQETYGIYLGLIRE